MQVTLALSVLIAGALARSSAHWNVVSSRAYPTTPQPSCNISEDAREGLNYELSNYINGPVTEDPFYTNLPANTASAAPGTLLKLESVSNATLFTLPPTTSVSRIIYQSENLNSKKVPVSAYILWPFFPRKQKDGKYQVVAWAHGTSGFTPNCAPSHIRNLWQHYLAPYALAIQGYVVVGTDYAGLGVPKYADGKPVVHEYGASPAQANDVFYSVQAARKAFPSLSDKFVIMGHSQGGGVAWAAAERQAKKPVAGYLGAIALSPLTRLLDVTTPASQLLALAIAPGVKNAYPEFNITDVATAGGAAGIDTLFACGGCSALTAPVLGATTPVKPEYKANKVYKQWAERVASGGKNIAGPLFVAHGKEDELVDFNLTVQAVGKTRKAFPASQIEFLALPDTSHIGSLQASQVQWVDWIAARFAGEKVKAGDATVQHPRPAEALALSLNWFIGIATEPYQTA